MRDEVEEVPQRRDGVTETNGELLLTVIGVKFDKFVVNIYLCANIHMANG